MADGGKRKEHLLERKREIQEEEVVWRLTTVEETCDRDAGCFATSSSPRVRDQAKVLSAGCGDLLSLSASSSAVRGVTRRLHVLTTAAHRAQGGSESKLHLVPAPGHLLLCTLPSERSGWKYGPRRKY